MWSIVCGAGEQRVIVLISIWQEAAGSLLIMEDGLKMKEEIRLAESMFNSRLTLCNDHTQNSLIYASAAT